MGLPSGTSLYSPEGVEGISAQQYHFAIQSWHTEILIPRYPNSRLGLTSALEYSYVLHSSHSKTLGFASYPSPTL